MSSLGARLRSAREQRGLEAQQLAERLNVSNSTISRWEKDQTHPRGAHLRGLSIHLGIPLDQLLENAAQSMHRADASPAPDMKSDRVLALRDFAHLILSTPGLRDFFLKFPWDEETRDLIERVLRTMEGEPDE